MTSFWQESHPEFVMSIWIAHWRAAGAVEKASHGNEVLYKLRSE